jgi:Kef-type K+ transport system membrane component KefB
MDHSFVFLLFELSLVLTAAKIGGLVARSVHLPEVLGELFAGVLLGNMAHLGLGFFEQIRNDPSLATLAELGAIILMFEVGVESTVRKLLEVGWNAMAVAMIGVIFPFLLGFAVTRLFFPHLSIWVDIFLGATLCATSVGISARVLKDLGKVQSLEGRTILGAAVVDDVLGLIVLAGVVAIIGSTASPILGEPGLGAKILLICLKAFAFLAGGIVLGMIFSKPLYRWAAKLRSGGMLLTLSLTFCFAFAYLAQKFGLAAIVGAFAAGLILEPEHSQIFREQEREPLERLILPLSTIFVPIFFFHIGMQVRIAALLSIDTLILGLVLSVAAIAGKLACSAGIILNRGSIDRWAIAFGMVPRGEVGLIFAGMGANLKIGGAPLLTPGLYAAVIVMVFITTAITPPLLVRRLNRVKLKNL